MLPFPPQVRNIFVGNDLELYRQDLTTKGVIDRNLLLYGDGSTLSTNYDSSQYVVKNGHVVTVKNVRLTNLQIPVYPWMPNDPMFVALLDY